MWTLLVSYAQGRGGVLDDLGNVIDTEPCGEFNLDVVDENLGNDFETEQLEPEKQGKLRKWRDRIYGLGMFLLLLWVFGYLIRLGWMVAGWIGHWILKIPGAFGNIAGLSTIIFFIFVITMLSSRLTAAKRDIRARKGERSLDDLSSIFAAVDQCNICGACGYLIKDIQDNEHGFVLCPECGAGWERNLWVDFFQQQRAGILTQLKKKQRKNTCLTDGRAQIFQVLMNQSDETREKKIRSRPLHLPFWDCFAVFFFVLLFLGGVAGLIAMASSSQSTTAGLIAMFIALLTLGGLVFYGIGLAKDGIRFRRMNLLARNLIDDLICPSCEGPISDDQHELDQMMICSECGLAWDQDTTKRKHHTKKRVPLERIKSDMVFNASPHM